MTAVVGAGADLRDEVEAQIGAIFTRADAAAASYGEEFAQLWTLASRHVQGGKLVRPILLLQTYEALRAEPAADPAERAEAVRIAAAVEALHYSFLLHDDVIDGDLFRRGIRNLVGELADTGASPARPGAPRHWAQTGGILAGDLLLSCAHQLFARVDLSADRRTRLLDLLDHTVLETTAGEYADVGLADGVISPELGTVLAMTGRKTATYSFELPLRAAVILAGGSPAVEERLREVGRHLGLAYQLQDDLLSTFGEAGSHGKDPFSDLREAKQTAIMGFARMCGEWPHIEADLGPDITVETAERVRERLRACGAEDFVRGLIRDEIAAFHDALSPDHADAVPEAARAVLVSLHERLERRRS